MAERKKSGGVRGKVCKEAGVDKREQRGIVRKRHGETKCVIGQREREESLQQRQRETGMDDVVSGDGELF